MGAAVTLQFLSIGAQKDICTGAYHHDVTLQAVPNAFPGIWPKKHS